MHELDRLSPVRVSEQHHRFSVAIFQVAEHSGERGNTKPKTGLTDHVDYRGAMERRQCPGPGVVARSGQEFKRLDVRWSNDREVTPIKSGELGDSESLTCSDDGRVNSAEREIPIGRDQLGDAQPIGGRH